jgi:hypothetical protein
MTTRCYCAACMKNGEPFPGISVMREQHVTEEDLRDRRPKRPAPPPAPAPKPAVTRAEVAKMIERNTRMLANAVGKALHELLAKDLRPRIEALEQQAGAEETPVHSPPIAGWRSPLE